MAGAPRLICPSSALRDGADGARFEVEYWGEPAAAFAVRFEGRVYGYLNRCRHVAMELDWNAGRFFDSDGRVLVCSSHGATYAAQTGACLGGPCDGTPLVPLRLAERDGSVYYMGLADD